MRVAILTREWPPEIYGGAGVHVEHLAEQLDPLVDLSVHCFGAPRDPAGRPRATAYAPDPRLVGANAALATVSVDVAMAAALEAEQPDVVHSHTWYADLGGHLASLLLQIPHVVTTHSLEPHRPWKAEQLGGGYALSSWAEKVSVEGAAAVIAVSEGMRRDVLEAYPALDPDRVRVVYNGVDTDRYAPDPGTDVVERVGLDPGRPTVLFVGRITRQKGLEHLIAAAADFAPDAQLLLLAGSPDTPEIAEETATAVAALQERRSGVHWVREMLPAPDLVQLLTHASVFVCPSVYEPLGIVNLEAMACGTAVVATATGGIPEVVVDGGTGLLVPFTPAGGGVLGPADPVAFAAAITERVNALLADPARSTAYGAAGRERAVAEFGWARIARQTVEVYEAARR